MRRITILVGVLCVVLSGTAGAQDQANQGSGAQSASVASAAPAASTAIALAKIDPAKVADIRHLLDVVGTTALVQQVMDNMVRSIKPLMANSLPPGAYRDTLIDLFFEKFRSQFDNKQLLDLAVVRYDENFSDEEIRGLIDFYQAPLGKKVASVLPKITTEMQQDGQKLGERLGRASMTEVLLEHPELKKAMQDAAAGGAANPH